MNATRPDCIRIGFVLAGLAYFAGPSICFGQNVFDPYRPEQAPYNAYTEPSLPNNLALPNAAREARQYNDLANGVGLGSRGRYNNPDRFLDDADTDFGTSRRQGGLPYYEATRRQNATSGRNGVAGRDADRAIAERQDAAVRLEAKKDRLYRSAVRERDPARREQILRDLAYLNSSRGAAEEIRADLAAGDASGRTAPRGAVGERSARPPLPGSGRSGRPAAAGGSLDRRPPLPSELPARERTGTPRPPSSRGTSAGAGISTNPRLTSPTDPAPSLPGSTPPSPTGPASPPTLPR